VNAVYKVPPYLPQTGKFDPELSLVDKDMLDLRKWGFNVVQLGVMWPGVEPSRGQIDEGYLNNVSAMAVDLAKYGHYTLVDLHQDLGSRRFCGEGFPEHYVDAMFENKNSYVSKARGFPFPQRGDHLEIDQSTGYPTIKSCLQKGFAQYYFTSQVGALWKEFYEPGTDINLGFSRYWKAVAGQLKDEPHIIGYELINEPSAYCLDGSAFSCIKVPGQLFGNAVEGKYLTPLYQTAAKVIRDTGATQPIFYEPTVPPKVFADAFPQKAVDGDNTVLAYHIYCASNNNNPADRLACNKVQDIYFNEFDNYLHDNKGVGGFLTEFGSVGGVDWQMSRLRRLLSARDKLFQSWAYWQFKSYNDFTSSDPEEPFYDGDTVETTKLKTLSRTYARAIGGVPSKMFFNHMTGEFDLDFEGTVTSEPTEIYLNEDLHYPNGHEVTWGPDQGCFTQRKVDEVNYLLFDLQEQCKGKTVTISIRKKAAQVLV